MITVPLRPNGADALSCRNPTTIGSLHQALVSGVLVQWLIDPGRAPSPAELALGMRAIAGQIAPASQAG